MGNFNNTTILAIWNKADVVQGYDSIKFRKDIRGAWIEFESYGKETTLGWEIDHILPLAKGCTDNQINLRPMQWKNNRAKADDFPTYKSGITSDGNNYIDKEETKSLHQDIIKQLKSIYPSNSYLQNL